MKKYSSKRAKKGKVAYRTPSPVRYKLVLKNEVCRSKRKKLAH